MNTKLETPYFIPYYALVFVAIVIISTIGFQSKQLSKPSTATTSAPKEKIDPTAVAPKVGYLAPDFTLETTKGDSVTLSDLRGNIIFLNIWATWCKPCRDEMPSMQEVWDKYKTDKFVMLAASVDKEKEKTVLPFMKEYGITFPVLYADDVTISKLYETTGVPETFIIDKTGRIIYKGIGPQNWSEPEALNAFDYIINGPKNHPQVDGAQQQPTASPKDSKMY